MPLCAFFPTWTDLKLNNKFEQKKDNAAFFRSLSPFNATSDTKIILPAKIEVDTTVNKDKQHVPRSCAQPEKRGGWSRTSLGLLDHSQEKLVHLDWPLIRGRGPGGGSTLFGILETQELSTDWDRGENKMIINLSTKIIIKTNQFSLQLETWY